MSGTTKVAFEDLELLDNMRVNPAKVDEMKKSLREVGQLMPIMVQWKHSTCVRPSDGKKVSSRYLVIDGATRYEAMRQIREEDHKAFAEVAVDLKKCNDSEAQMLMLVSNVARNDFTPMDTANGINRLRNLGYKMNDISTRIGRSVAWCDRLVKMGESLSKPVLDAMTRGDVTFNAASSWVGMPEEKQVQALKNYGEVKATKGKREAKRQANRDGDRPDKPSAKDAKQALEDCTVLGAYDNYRRGEANGIRYMMGLYPKLAETAAKEAAKVRKESGDGKGDQTEIAETAG